MSDGAVFRTAVAPVAAPAAQESTDTARTSGSNPSTLMATYQDSVGHPYSADYYGIPTHWSDPQGGHPVEVAAIEEYLKDLVRTGDLDNSTLAAKQRLQKIEREAGVDKTTGLRSRVRQVAAYVAYLRKAGEIRGQS